MDAVMTTGLGFGALAQSLDNHFLANALRGQPKACAASSLKDLLKWWLPGSPAYRGDVEISDKRYPFPIFPGSIRGC